MVIKSQLQKAEENMALYVFETLQIKYFIQSGTKRSVRIAKQRGDKL